VTRWWGQPHLRSALGDLAAGGGDRPYGPVDEVVFAFVELTPTNQRKITWGPREDAAGLTGADTRPVEFDALQVPLTHVIGRQPTFRSLRVWAR
jgi:alkylation response protein AidB-like acyl-CoA dehydrogenase